MSAVPSLSDSSEWLEADGLGGFASGTATGIRIRRYHALLLMRQLPQQAEPSSSTAWTSGWILSGAVLLCRHNAMFRGLSIPME